jgi:dethiobiotin synthetase
MSSAIVVTGTDTDVGKTVFAAGLVAALDGFYWKPVQAGLEGETDADIVQRLSGLSAARVLPEVYRFTTAASPHLAAERDGITIDIEGLAKAPLLDISRVVVIEGAGGLLVPLTRSYLQIELFARWAAPVVLVAATRLGTINHTLLSVEALRRRQIPLLGVAFVGGENADSERTITEMGGVRHLGRLPIIDPLDAGTLRSAFAANFRPEDFLAPVPT